MTPDQSRPPAPVDADGKLVPHGYWPDTEAMGDCASCGNVSDSPIHVEPAQPRPPAPGHVDHGECPACWASGTRSRHASPGQPRPEAPYITGLEQTPIQRLLEHQRKDEHHWVWNMLRRVIACTVCGIAQSDWEQMRQARAQLDQRTSTTIDMLAHADHCPCRGQIEALTRENACLTAALKLMHEQWDTSVVDAAASMSQESQHEVPADSMTTLERQLTAEVERLRAAHDAHMKDGSWCFLCDPNMAAAPGHDPCPMGHSSP